MVGEKRKSDGTRNTTIEEGQVGSPGTMVQMGGQALVISSDEKALYPYDEPLLPDMAREARNEIVRLGLRGELPSMLDLDILSKIGRRSDRTWSRRLPDGRELAYDLVLTSYREGRTVRLIAHLQSPGPLKTKAIAAIRKDLHRQFGASLIAEVERIGEVTFLAGRRRRSAKDNPWGIAAPISVSTGAPGTTTVFVRPAGAQSVAPTHAFTAGHVLCDGDGKRSTLGEKVYHPATQGTAPTADHQYVASVEHVLFRAAPAWNLMGGASIPLAADSGLLALKNTPPNPTELPDGGELKGILKFVGDDPLPRNSEVWKVSAATPRSKGRVAGASSTVLFRSMDGVAWAASGLIAIMGVNGSLSGDGDSGVLIMGNDKTAIGFLIAATSVGQLPGGHIGVSYALPLYSALEELGMELAL